MGDPRIPPPDQLAAAMAYVKDMANPADKRARVQATLDALPQFDMALPASGAAPKVAAAGDVPPPAPPSGKTPEQEAADRELEGIKDPELPPEPMSRLAAFATMFPQGMTFGWGDELAGAAGPGGGMEGLNVSDSVPTLDPSATADARQRIAQAEHDQPWTSRLSKLVGNALGAVPAAFAGSAALGSAAAFTPAQMLMGGIEGGGLGALSGAGEAEDGQKEEGALHGLAAGGPLGFLLPGVLRPVASKIGDYVGDLASELRGFGTGAGGAHGGGVLARKVTEKGSGAVKDFGSSLEETKLAGPGSPGVLPATPGRMLPRSEQAMDEAGKEIEAIGSELQGPPEPPMTYNPTGGFRRPTESGGSGLARDENAFVRTRVPGRPPPPRGEPPAPIEYPALAANAPSRAGEIVPPAPGWPGEMMPAESESLLGRPIQDARGRAESLLEQNPTAARLKGAGSASSPRALPAGDEGGGEIAVRGEKGTRYRRELRPEERGRAQPPDDGNWIPGKPQPRGERVPFDIEDAVLVGEPRPGITVDLGKVSASLRQDAQELAGLPLTEAKRQAESITRDADLIGDSRFTDYKTAHRLRQKLDSLGFNAAGQKQTEAAALYRKMAAKVNEAIDDAAYHEQPDNAARLLDANRRYSVAADAYHASVPGYIHAGKALSHGNPLPIIGQNATIATSRALREAQGVAEAAPQYAPAALGAMLPNLLWAPDVVADEDNIDYTR